MKFKFIQSSQVEVQASKLATSAFTVWFASLFFTGFKEGFQGEDFNGFMILLIGLPFGWMVLGFAVYANLFFIIVYYKIIDNKRPVWSVFCMVILVATLPLFKEFMTNENGAMAPVTAWGWGAVIWLIAVVMMASAALIQKGLLKKRGLLLVGFFVLAGLLGILWLHLWQYKRANNQEKTLFLDGMAFMMLEPCGVELSWPEQQLIQSGEIIRVDIDPDLVKAKKDRPYFYLPLPRNYINVEEGHDWQVYDNILDIHVRQNEQGNYSTLSAKSTPDGALIQLIDKNKHVLFEQKLNYKSFGKYTYYCPLRSQNQTDYPQRKLAEGFDTALDRALGINLGMRKKQMPSLLTEFAEESCGFKISRRNDGKALGILDGRNVITRNSWLQSYKEFCSDHYIALVQASESTVGTPKLRCSVFIFDRKTLRPIVRFNSKLDRYNDKFSDLHSSQLKSMLISRSEALVNTNKGQILAGEAEALCSDGCAE